MWLQTLTQVAVFATIVGIFIAVAAWVNGRRTTRQIQETIQGVQKETNRLIGNIGERMESIGESMKSIGESMKSIGERIESIEKRMDEGFRKLSDQHETMVKILERISTR